MRNWMFIISVFLLAACNEVVYLRNDEKPVLVLYAILEAGCDSMRIRQHADRTDGDERDV